MGYGSHAEKDLGAGNGLENWLRARVRATPVGAGEAGAGTGAALSER